MTKREWISVPRDIQINTDLGPVFLSVVQGDYVYVDASGNGKFITYKGNKYAMNLRLHTYDGGKTWEPSKDKYGHASGSVSAHKWQSYQINNDMPPTYKAKAVAEIIAKVSAHLAAHPELRAEADYANANNSLLAEQATFDELKEKLAEQAIKLAAAVVHEEDAEKKLAAAGGKA